MKDCSDLLSLAQEKVQFGQSLLNSLTQYNQIEGIQKLSRKIKQELSFLEKISRDESIKKEHLQCSNLTHFNALIQTLRELQNCQSVNKVFNLGDKKISVDIICDEGLTWVKVIARNPKSLAQISAGDTGYGVRSIVDQAEDYLECAKQHPCLFRTPKIMFVFFSGISNDLSETLEELGIVVRRTRIEHHVENGYSADSSDLSTKNVSHILKINLDVSAMLAYVSSITNGSCNRYKFTTPVLIQQAEWESRRPVKPILDAYFQGKNLYCCETARNSFINILNTVGGSNEKIRGQELLSKLIVLPDNATASDTEGTNANLICFSSVQFSSNKVLNVGGKIRERSLIIFKFGDRIQAVTVTSNDGFVRAAKQQGIYFVVFVHESRALTEQKESKAIKL
ncbi:hypothetical protein PPYR_04135 [Photinus pyralis]|uniref:DUF1308 domain-containing protein n=3 Tax=Photinus pyralis TaxID=7054 RepID=A0A5N4AX83_PHOPY|nr:UPF0415 protein C7orf25 homolog [Photinus pyralis]KAB0801949.1 hypothetical protein PPYR_04135 [Photinus pyralis]